MALFSGCCADGAQGGEGLSALMGSKTAGDLHLHLHHPERLLGEIVGEGNLEVDEEPEHVVFEPVQAQQQVVSCSSFCPAAFGAAFFRRGRLRWKAMPSRTASQ